MQTNPYEKKKNNMCEKLYVHILLLFTRLSIIRNTQVYIPFERLFFALHDKIKINLIAPISQKRLDGKLVRA